MFFCFFLADYFNHFRFLTTKLGDDIDFSILDTKTETGLLFEWQDMEAAIPARKKFGVENRGLPLLVAYLLWRLAVDGLKVHFPIRKGFLQRTVGHVRAVDGVSLAISPGRTLALVGESGCGKTTVGKALLQLIAPSAGSVRLGDTELVGLKGRRLRAVRRHMQMIFQDPFASLNPRLRVGEIIAEGMESLGVVGDTASRRAAVVALLAQVGLPDEAIDRYPHEFSGGQRQRIAVARALAVQPELLICDEPTSALDVSVQAQILNLLKKLQGELGIAYLFITHNFAVVEYLAHDVAVMYLGRIVEQGRAEEVLRKPQHPYTRALLSAVPAPRLEATAVVIRLPGETPSPANPPAGCHFHPRCPHANARCSAERPAMIDKDALQEFVESLSDLAPAIERDVARLLALGQSNKEVARQLSISDHTVHVHRQRITEKTGSGHAADLARLILRADPNSLDED